MTQWKKLRGIFSRSKKKIEITIETRESWEINWFRQSKAEKCPVCHSETIFIPVALSAKIVQIEKSEVERLIKTNQIHFQFAGNNQKMLCLSSLKKTLEENFYHILR